LSFDADDDDDDDDDDEEEEEDEAGAAAAAFLTEGGACVSLLLAFFLAAAAAVRGAGEGDRAATFFFFASLGFALRPVVVAAAAAATTSAAAATCSADAFLPFFAGVVDTLPLSTLFRFPGMTQMIDLRFPLQKHQTNKLSRYVLQILPFSAPGDSCLSSGCTAAVLRVLDLFCLVLMCFLQTPHQNSAASARKVREPHRASR